MQVGFWGVRGSLPAPRRDTWRYGGNTPCLEVRAGQQIILLDAGSGILDLGRQLCLEFAGTDATAHLLCTHYHWDHIQGLPWFAPLRDPKWTLYLYGPRPLDGSVGLRGLLPALFAAPFFPVEAKELPSTRHLRELAWKNDFVIGDVRVRTCRVHHPQGALAIRLDHRGSSLVYATDHEPGDPLCDYALSQLARKADVLVSDAQFRPDELRQRAGWGHGSWEPSVVLARDAGVKNLVLFHHDPFRSDLEIDHFVGHARASGIVELRAHDLRQWTDDRRRTVDDYPYGGGPGMVMKPEPLVAG
ncbi:MAG: MBL fold metallo-hydrolase, partial [Terriglobia bacterium]